MILPVGVTDKIDEALRNRLNEAYALNEQNPTLENRAAYKEAVRAFADWVLRRKLPEGFQNP